MEQLIHHVKTFLGDKVRNVVKKGPAEIEIILQKGTDAQKVIEALKNHIVEIIEEDTIAKLTIVDDRGNLVDHFSLNQ